MQSFIARGLNRTCCCNNLTESAYALAEAGASRYGVLGLQLLVCLLTVACNSCIVLAMVIERSLRSLRNAYLFSLAMADLLMGCIVMPLAIAQQLSGTHSIALKVVWRTFDAFASTASVWSICCIAVERYATIRKPVYCRQSGTNRKMCMLIAPVWLLSVLITVPVPILHCRAANEQAWSPAIDVVFVVVSFVLPATVTLWVYLRIFRIAYLLVKTLRAGQIRVKVGGKNTAILRVHQGSLPRGGVAGNRYARYPLYRTSKLVSPDLIDSLAVVHMVIPPPNEERGRPLSARESTDGPSVTSANETGVQLRRGNSSCTTTSNIKATKTLGGVIFCFLIALTPKSVFILLNATMSDVVLLQPGIFMFVTYLAHANSLLNPLIYGWSLVEFRKVFLRWICRLLKVCCPTVQFNHRFFFAERSVRPYPSMISGTMWANNNSLLL